MIVDVINAGETLSRSSVKGLVVENNHVGFIVLRVLIALHVGGTSPRSFTKGLVAENDNLRFHFRRVVLLLH